MLAIESYSIFKCDNRKCMLINHSSCKICHTAGNGKSPQSSWYVMLVLLYCLISRDLLRVNKGSSRNRTPVNNQLNLSIHLAYGLSACWLLTQITAHLWNLWTFFCQIDPFVDLIVKLHASAINNNIALWCYLGTECFKFRWKIMYW